MSWNPEKRTVLVPFVLSEASIEALEVAESMLAADGTVHVIHVIPPASTMTPGIVYGTFNAQDLELRASETMRSELDKAGHGKSVLHVVTGEPASSIRDCAKKVGADLIVIPSHGRGGFERWFLGSVSEHVLRHAPCPVLVLNIKDDVE